MAVTLEKSKPVNLEKPKTQKKKIKVRLVNRAHDNGHSWTTIDEFGRRVTLKWWY